MFDNLVGLFVRSTFEKTYSHWRFMPHPLCGMITRF